jgi:hypothetical protein
MTHDRITIIKSLVSLGALIVLIVYLIWPFSLNPVVIVLLCIIILPWLSPVLKSVELPFGVKIEFQDLKKVEEKAERVGLVSHSTSTLLKPTYSFQSVAGEDPRLALAGLRIELETRLIDLLKAKGYQASGRGIVGAVRQLAESDVLSHQETSALLDIVIILNKAVHGAQLDEQTSHRALDLGVRVLQAIEAKR